ncbi:hypothetical protein ACF09H_29515 [Streptomyces sp. NPDC014983]|uniref:hypothetical protein n=1 Tax=Streptomyces sp. NPDC014983 TaxID=3364933 RepID=UPI0036F87558
MQPVRSARPAAVPRARPAGPPPRPRTPPLGPHPDWEHHKIFQEPYYHDPVIRQEIEQEALDYDDPPLRRPGTRRHPS